MFLLGIQSGTIKRFLNQLAENLNQRLNQINSFQRILNNIFTIPHPYRQP